MSHTFLKSRVPNRNVEKFAKAVLLYSFCLNRICEKHIIAFVEEKIFTHRDKQIVLHEPKEIDNILLHLHFSD